MTDSTSSIEEWRKSVDKTLKYYKDKIKNLKTNNKLRLKKLQSSYQREKRVLNNKIKSLQKKNESLMQQFEEQKYILRQEIRSLRKKLKSSKSSKSKNELNEMNDLNESNELNESHEAEGSDSEHYQIHIHKIFDYCSNKKSEVNVIENVDRNDIKININKHSLRLQKWMKNTQILIDGYNECISLTPTKTTKKPSTSQQNDKLLSKYGDYKQLMAEQECKMEEISQFVSDLIAEKRKIKQFMGKYENDIPHKNELYKQAFTEYDEIRSLRKKIYLDLLDSVDRLNETIDDENKLNEKKCKLFDEYNCLRGEIKEFKNEINDCSALIKKYQTFDQLNDEKIPEMKTYFKKEWNHFMEQWSEWDYTSIIIWIKYLIIENQLVLSQNIDLSQIENEMKKLKINGLWFQQIDKNELKSVGFENLNDREQIFHKIQGLISKYPILNKLNDIYDAEGQCSAHKDTKNHVNSVQIPKQFLCPISKKIMMEPVLLSIDSYTYERNAILLYLKQNKNKSPITNEVCDDDEELVILPNRKLAQKIQTFLFVHPHLKTFVSV